jgi:protein O-mannosyl-transferase
MAKGSNDQGNPLWLLDRKDEVKEGISPDSTEPHANLPRTHRPWWKATNPETTTMTKRKRVVRRHQGAPSTIIKRTANTNKWVARWICAALVVVALLPYLETLRSEFIRFDDGAYVAENPQVQQGLTWANVAWAFTTTSTGNWHPLTWLSHMMDCQFFGLRPGWHHLMNALLHGANTALLFVVLRAMTGMSWRSALVAALFAIHPLHVESVAWIAERKDVLSTLFGLLALWAYARYVSAPSVMRYGLVASFFALSLLSKPMLVTLPFALLLLDLWPLKRFSIENRAPSQSPKFVSLVLEKLPLLAMSATSSVVTFKAQRVGGAVAPIDIWPLSQRLAHAVVAYVSYLSKVFWPVDLAVIYPFQDQALVARTALGILMMVGITIGVGLLIHERPWLAVGWLWFLGTLVPVIGLVQVGAQSMADRYTYVPLIGLFIMIAWSLPSAVFAATNRGRTAAMAAVALILTTLTTVTFAQVHVWKNTITLFDHALKVTEGNYMAHNLLAGALRQKGDLIGARNHIEKSLQIRPSYADAHYDLGTIMLQQRDFAKALEQFNLALQTKQQDPMIWNGLGMAKAHLGRMDEAISNYRHALSLDPNYGYALANLGAVLLAQKKYDEAIEMCERALRLRPDQAETHAALAAALWNRGRVDESIWHGRKAVELNPDLLDARFNLGWALYKNGNYDEAIAHLEYVLRFDPERQAARTALNAAKQERNGASTQP